MNWKIFFNPFEKYDDRKLLIAGLVGFVILNTICILIGNRMNGILHYEIIEKENIQNILIVNFGIMLSAIIIFFFYGKIINKNTRFIDVANAFLLSSIPSSLLILWGEIPIFTNASQRLAEIASSKSLNISASTDLLIVCLSAAVGLPLVALIIILMFNGFKTATNMKKTGQIIVFFALLFILNAITQTYF